MLFTRQPDYFDSERANGTIVRSGEKLVAAFTYNDSIHYATVPYPFLHKQGERKVVIYETANPSNASVYSVLGYWISLGELLASILVVVVLYYVAVSITNNPTPQALLDDLEMGKRKPRKPKYDP